MADADATMGDAPASRLMITKMVLENFKSYGGVREIGPFHKRFSSVVGPNGSGKSNVIDAMLFVFGKRAKKLRLNKVSELIHRSEQYPNLDSARVSVHFADVLDEDGADPDSFTIVEGSELVVSRTAFSSNQSKYDVDGKAATFKEVGALLRRKGIDLDNNRFLILQGEVEQIAMMKPKAPSPHEEGLLEYLEDIIGSNNYVEPIEAASQKVDEACEARTEKLNRLKVTEKERESLSAARDEAEAFVGAEDALRRQRNLLYQVSRHEAASNVALVEGRHAELSQRLKEEGEKLCEKRKAVEKSLQGDVAEAKALETSYAEASKALEEASSRATEAEKRAAELTEGRKHRVVALRKAEAARKKEQSIIQEKEEFIREQLEDEQPRCAKKAEVMSRKADEAEAALDGVREACAAETASAQKALDDKTSSDLAPLTEKLSEAEAAVREVQDELDVVLDGPRAAQTELEAVEAKLQNADEERDAKEEKLRTAKKDVADLRKKASTYEKQLGEDGSLVKKRRQAESARDAALQRLEDAKALLQRQKESSSKDAKGVVGEVLKAARKGSLSSCGVCGRLGDLGSIDPKYDVAVSTAADMLDHVVVETAAGGQKCIEFLRAKNLGRANFIVLDQVKKAKGKPTTPDNAPRLLDLIEISDPKYADAFAMTLRDTLVAESLDEAVKLAYRPDNSRWRVVTTKGQLIDTSGTMSGGGGKPRQGRMLLDGEATVAIAQCAAQEDEVKEKDLPPLEKACVKATKDAEKASEQVRVAEEALADLERQIRRLEDLVMPTLEAEIGAVEATCKQLQPRLETLRKATVVDAATKKKCAALEKKLGTLEASRDKAKKAFDVVDAEVQELRAAVVDAGGDPLRKALAKAEICRQLADDASNEVESIAVQVKAAEKALKKAKKAYDKADADATRLKEDVDGSQEELERIAAEKDEVLQAKVQAQQACDSAANALSVKKAELETLSQDADAIKAVEVDIQNQVDDYARALKDNGKKQKQCDALLKELRAEHAAEVRDFAQVFQEMDARKREEAREAALVGGAAPMDEDAPPPVPEEGAMDEDAAPADADADAPPPVPEEGDGAAPAEPEAAAAPPPAPETDERPWETLPSLDTETLESADKEQIKYDIAVLEEERDRLKKICNLDTIRQYREKESEYQERLTELEKATDVRNTCREKLEDLRKKRLDEFMAGFARITLKLKEMYQMITLGGDAELELVDSLDPFSEGVVFSVRPPKKSWKHIANLSGGEKTLSSLALVFALHHYKPTPLYVMDEIDAALDYKNVSIIANYIKDRCTSAQFVIISLRNNMFELADRLTGVYKTHNVTKTITISPAAFAATLSGLPAPPSNALGDATNTAVAAQ